MDEIEHKVRVLIVEDEPLIAENLAMYLNNHDYEVVGMAYDYDDGIDQLKQEIPDIVLLDINLDGQKDGVDLAKFIFENLKIPFIFLSSYSDKATLDRVKNLQPSGYLVKPFHEKTLLATLEISLANYAKSQYQLNEELQLNKLNSGLNDPLSQREFEVLQLIYAGKTNQQISQLLYISLNTLKRHINNSYLRLGVNSRTTAMIRLRELMKN